METTKLFYDNVSNIVFDANGKEYPIKEYNRSKCVNVGDKRIALSKLEQKPLIRDFDDVVFNYVFAWHSTYPCPAIGYFVYRKVKKNKITLKDYKLKFGVKKLN
jgi:hypothetical protein